MDYQTGLLEKKKKKNSCQPYSHDIILVLFEWIIKQDYKKKKNSNQPFVVMILFLVLF